MNSGLCTVYSFPRRKALTQIYCTTQGRYDKRVSLFLEHKPSLSCPCFLLSSLPEHLRKINPQPQMTSAHAGSWWNCHMERRKAKQIGWHGFGCTRLVWVSVAPIVSNFHAVLTAIHGVPTGVSSQREQASREGEKELYARKSQALSQEETYYFWRNLPSELF